MSVNFFTPEFIESVVLYKARSNRADGIQFMTTELDALLAYRHYLIADEELNDSEAKTKKIEAVEDVRIRRMALEEIKERIINGENPNKLFEMAYTIYENARESIDFIEATS